jgi:hypothetical protein
MHGRFLLAALAIGVTAGFAACREPTRPPETGPLVKEQSLVLDSAARAGTLHMVVHDLDGPVRISCGGAFSGEAITELMLVRPFSELRFHDYLSTVCEAVQGDDALTVFLSVEGRYAIDRPAHMEPLRIPPRIRVGEPSSWRLAMTDDWALGEYWFSIAPGVDPDCFQRWIRIGTWNGEGLQKVDTTVTVTFESPGMHCVVAGILDDREQGQSWGELVEVMPSEARLSPLAAPGRRAEAPGPGPFARCRRWSPDGAGHGARTLPRMDERRSPGEG